MADGQFGWSNNVTAKYKLPTWLENHPKEGRDCAAFVPKLRKIVSVDCTKRYASICFVTNDETYDSNINLAVNDEKKKMLKLIVFVLLGLGVIIGTILCYCMCVCITAKGGGPEQD